MTKDGDFVCLLHDHGPPPQILRIRLGSTSTARTRAALEATFDRAMSLLQNGEAFGEIRDNAATSGSPKAAQQCVAAEEAGPVTPSRPHR
jgi:hypothetical protein